MCAFPGLWPHWDHGDPRLEWADYGLFRIDKPGSPGVAFSVREQLECLELCLGVDERPTETLGMRIKERKDKGDIVEGICYRPPDQEEWPDEALCREIGAASCCQTLIIVEDFNYPSICLKDNTAGHSNPRCSWRAPMTDAWPKWGSDVVV